MLKLKTIKNVTQINVKSDYYIPIDIDFYFNPINWSPSMYWKTGYMGKTLLELLLEQESGFIKSITMTLLPKIKVIQQYSACDKNANTKNGSPVFDVKKYGNQFVVEEPINFEAILSNNNLFIIFSNDKINLKVANERVIFGFNEKKALCLIEVKDLSAEEIENLKINQQSS